MRLHDQCLTYIAHFLVASSCSFKSDYSGNHLFKVINVFTEFLNVNRVPKLAYSWYQFWLGMWFNLMSNVFFQFMPQILELWWVSFPFCWCLAKHALWSGVLGMASALQTVPFFLYECLRWLSIWTVLSSLHMTPSNPSVRTSCKFSKAHWNRFHLFSAQMSWQYFDPLKVHPRICRLRTIVVRLIGGKQNM